MANEIEATMHKPVHHLVFFLLAMAVIVGCARRPTPPAVLPSAPQSSGYTDAVELKLKFREMADQMLATVPNEALKGYVAMPTAFVNENDTSQTSPLGRLIAESMFYEFNQRGFPTREYRLTGKEGTALLTGRGVNAKGQKWAALLVGTYQLAKDAIFVNARLVRASDGLVLRTAEVVLPSTPTVLSLAAGGAGGGVTSAPAATVRPPSYPTLGGTGSGTGYIPIIQGR